MAGRILRGKSNLHASAMILQNGNLIYVLSLSRFPFAVYLIHKQRKLGKHAAVETTLTGKKEL